jgi:flagellar hook protein FlgE
MALSNSLNTGLTGLDTSSRKLSIAGNNIANVNTFGYKKSRVSFETTITRTLKDATGPTAAQGGTNPQQIGLGSKTASVTRDFSGGSLQPTGVNTDMAIEGNGFFVVESGETQRFTRAGNFDLDQNNELVTQNGWKVMGYGVNDNFELDRGQVEPLNVPLGNLTTAEATQSATLGGNLNAAGDVATQGSIVQTGLLHENNGTGPAATAGSNLTNLYDDAGNKLFNTNDVITLEGATKGGRELPAKTFEVNNANTTDSDDFGQTLGDFRDFIDDALGIDTGVGGGTSITGAGRLQITGNSGTANDLDIDSSDIVKNKTGTPSNPFTMSKTQDADGESVSTTFTAFDSLGNEMDVDLTMVLDNKSNQGTTWRYFAQSEQDSDLDRTLGTGTLEFDNNGQLRTANAPTINIDRDGTGAVTPQEITLNFQSDEDNKGGVTALADQNSNLTTRTQDGAGTGTLEDFSVGEDGIITGRFTNNLQRTIGQVALAQFTNPEGLADIGDNKFAATRNSGNPQIGEATEAGRGRILGSTLEQANVDITEEFTDLISAQTGFQANSRVIQTSSQLLQQLINSVQ